MNKVAAVLVAITVTSIVWLVAIEEVRYKHLKAMEKDVWQPVIVIINDLNLTLAERDYETLGKKMHLFDKRWRDYFPDGDAPLIFKKEILDIGMMKNAGK
jgi:hypothetical protein